MLHSFEILVAQAASSSVLSSGRLSLRKTEHALITASSTFLMMSSPSSLRSAFTWRKMTLMASWKSESAYERLTIVRVMILPRDNSAHRLPELGLNLAARKARVAFLSFRLRL